MGDSRSASLFNDIFGILAAAESACSCCNVSAIEIAQKIYDLTRYYDFCDDELDEVTLTDLGVKRV